MIAVIFISSNNNTFNAAFTSNKSILYCDHQNKMDKFCLKWANFERNIRSNFRKLKDDPKLADVTLATDDGQHIKAHKIILSTGSHFFSDLFLKSNHASMLIYLKGVSSFELEPVLGFLYNGEAFVAQEDLNQFIKTGKELQVKGLEEQFTGVSENILEEQNKIQVEEELALKHNNATQEASYSMEPVVYSVDDDEYPDPQINAENAQLTINSELDFQIQEMVEKKKGVWRCKICEKTASMKGQIQQHAETHIEGINQICYICSKTFRTRVALRVHKHRHHRASSS